jgi:uncharacterized protein (TIGR02598 family)
MKRRALTQNGFSLPEVTIAVGIASLGILTLLGMIPQGLDMARDGSRSLSEIRIVQQIVGEAQLSDWAAYMEENGPAAPGRINRCFDDQGVEIPRGSPDMGMRLTYVARLQVQDGDVPMPGNSASTASNGPAQDIRRLKIEVASSTNPEFDFAQSSSRLVKVHTALISRTTPDISSP